VGDIWQDKTTGEWFRRVPATEEVVAETGKSWMDEPVKGPSPTTPQNATSAKPNQTKKAKKDHDDVVEAALDVAVNIVGAGFDAGLDVMGDIAGGIADLS
jgi:hypothetical protein